MSFGATGGTIGRAAGNDWVLPDPNFYTSGRHAEIKLDGDQFVVVDLSTNGTFHNSPEQLVGKNRSANLVDGDRLYIGEFVLVVGIEQAEVESEPKPDPLFEDDDDDLLPPPSDAGQAGTDTAPNAELERDEFDDLLDGVDDRQSAQESPDDGDLPFPSSGRQLGPLDLDDDDEDQSDAGSEPRESTGAGLSQSPEREYFSAPGVSAEQSEEDIPDEWDALLTGFFEPPAKPSRQEDADRGSEDSVPSSRSDEPMSIGQPEADQDSDRQADRPLPTSDPSAGAASEPVPEPPQQPPPQAVPRRPSPPRPAQRAVGDGGGQKARSSASGSESELVAQLLHELGIGDMAGSVDPEDFAEQVGKVVRLVGEGLMQLLASRAEIKNEFRIDQTRIASARNNPLKFSPSIEEAMRRVFVERDAPGFISGAEAFELALNDLRAHQVAILAAVQGAIESVIRQFNPEELERKLKKLSPLSASAPLIREAKCWNLFTAHYDEMASNLRHDAKRVFVREFAEAYERSSSEIARQIAESRGKSGSKS